MSRNMNILPLVEKAIPGAKAVAGFFGLRPGREEAGREFAEWLGSQLEGADPAGFRTLGYGELLEKAAALFRESEDYLLENPWALRGRLEEAGVIAAPDSNIERRRLKSRDEVVIYRSDNFMPMIRTRGYKKALLLVKFLTLAFSPLNDAELAFCDSLVGEWVKQPRYRRHMSALLRWFNGRRRLLDARTKRVFGEIMTQADREAMAGQLLQAASMRGLSLSAKSLRELDRLLAMCGHRPGDVHVLLHRSAQGEGARPAAVAAKPGANETAGLLDTAKLKKIEESTRKVQSLLAPIMQEEEEPQPAERRRRGGRELLLQILGEREEWKESELADRFAEAQKEEGAPAMPLGVALEELNDLAADTAGDTVAEIDGGMIYIDTEVLQEIKEKQ